MHCCVLLFSLMCETLTECAETMWVICNLNKVEVKWKLKVSILIHEALLQHVAQYI